MSFRDLLVLARRRWYLAAGWVTATLVAALTTSYDIWAAFWVFPLLALATIPLARRLDLGPGSPSGPAVVAAGFLVKVGVGTIARYAMVHGFYEGDSDAERYHRIGSELAPAFRRLDYSDIDRFFGSHLVDALTGQIYAITGPTRLGGFMVFSWLAFLGMWLCVRAVQIALPRAATRRYALLLFLWPAMWFWPSSAGKDAPMIAAFGLTLLGLAKLFDGQRSGPPIAVAGAALVTIVRPHMTFLIAAAALAALVLFAIRPPPSPSTTPTPSVTYRVLLIAGLLVGVALAAPVAAERFGLRGVDVSGARALLEQTAARTNAGDARFDAPDPETVLGYPAAALTVLFRPTPWESSRAQELLASLEGILLLVAGLRFRHSIVDALRGCVRHPFLAFSLTYIGLFFFTFGRFESFAILSRQRTQLIPILLVLLSVETRPISRVRHLRPEPTAASEPA